MLISFPYCVDACVLIVKLDARISGRGSAGECRTGAGLPVRSRLVLAFAMLYLLSGDTWPSDIEPGADQRAGRVVNPQQTTPPCPLTTRHRNWARGRSICA